MVKSEKKIPAIKQDIVKDEEFSESSNKEMKDEQEIQQIKGRRPDPRAHKIIGDESMQDE